MRESLESFANGQFPFTSSSLGSYALELPPSYNYLPSKRFVKARERRVAGRIKGRLE